MRRSLLCLIDRGGNGPLGGGLFSSRSFRESDVTGTDNPTFIAARFGQALGRTYWAFRTEVFADLWRDGFFGHSLSLLCCGSSLGAS